MPRRCVQYIVPATSDGTATSAAMSNNTSFE